MPHPVGRGKKYIHINNIHAMSLHQLSGWFIPADAFHRLFFSLLNIWCHSKMLLRWHKNSTCDALSKMAYTHMQIITKYMHIMSWLHQGWTVPDIFLLGINTSSLKQVLLLKCTGEQKRPYFSYMNKVHRTNKLGTYQDTSSQQGLN